jgi:hypothetical protein
MRAMSTDAPADSAWQRLRRAASGLLFPRYWMVVVAQAPLELVLNSDGREVTADGKARRVVAGEKVLATFEAMQAVDLVRHPRDDAAHKPEHWSVSLYLGRSQRAFVGRSRKHAQAKKAASLLATITGKPLRELEGLGPNSHLPSR